PSALDSRGLLRLDHFVGGCFHGADMGWSGATAECRPKTGYSLPAREASGRRRADGQPIDVVRRVFERWGRVVSHVAIAELEWTGRCAPDVCGRRRDSSFATDARGGAWAGMQSLNSRQDDLRRFCR